MAAPVAVAGSSPGLCPSFAVVCSFLERYGAALDLPELTFPQMERYLQETSSVPKPLVELHVKLLRKIGKSVTPDRWEKYLVKVCQDFNCTWAWELESKGYPEMTVESKTGILKYLCESQFDENIKFKTSVNEEDPDRMRLQPIGKDKEGLMYWFQVDQDQNVRVYVEEQDDLDGATWKCIVRNRNDLAQTLETLKAQIDLGPSDQKQGDGSTCASPVPEDDENYADNEETKKDVAETQTSEKSADGLKTEEAEKDKSSSSKDTKEGQKEQNERLQSTFKKDEEENIEMEMVINKKDIKSEEKPVIDNRVSTIISLVKEEPKDSEVAWNAVSVVKAPASAKQEVGAKAEAREEASEKTLEEVERTFKNDQQAKIPLKKRELKLSEGFGNNLNSNSNHHPSNTLNNNGTLSSGIIVRNPSVVLSKGPWPSKEEAPSTEEGRTVCSQASDVTGTGIKRDTRPDLCNGEMAPGRGFSLNVREHCVSVGVIMGPLDRKKSFADHNVPVAADRNGITGNYIKTITSRNSEGKGEPTAQQDGIPSPGTVRQSVLVRKATTPEGVETILPKPFEGQVMRTPEADLSTSVVVNKLDRKTEESSCSVNIPQSADETVNKVCKETKPQTTEQSAERSGAEKEIAAEEEEGEEDEGTVGKGQGQAESKITEDIDASPRAFSKESESGSSGDDGSEPDEDPDEVSSEIQKEGIRLKIKIPMHRRTPEFQREREQQEASDGHSLRRSARICRPSPKLAEIQDRRQEKKHAGSSGGQEDKETGDSEVRKNSQKKENPRKTDSDGQNKPGKMRRRHRRPRWTNSRSKGRKKGEGEEAVDEKKTKEETQENYPSDRERHHSDSDSAQSAEMPNDDPCRHCGLPNHPELILLCDLCDNGYHTACLRPPLMIIPDGEWFCPPCQHRLLCERLEEQLQNLDTALKKKERAERRRERLVYVGISVENIIPTPQDGEGEEKLEKKKSTKKNKNLERRSTRTRKSISYRFDDFDEAIDEAIEEDVRETEGQGSTGRGKDMATITGQQKGKENQEGKENQRPAKPIPAHRRKKRRRLNDLDSDSTVDEEESEEDFHFSSSTEEEEFVVSGEDAGSDGDAGSNDCSDWGSTTSKPSQRRSKRTATKGQVHRARTRGRSGRRPLSRQRAGLSDEDEEEELETDEEEEEEEMETEGSSDVSDSDVDTRRRRSRRSQRMQVNYCETSESEGSQKVTKKDKPQPHRRRLTSSNSEGSEGEKEDEKRTKKAKRHEPSREESRRLALKRRRDSTDEEDNSGDDDSDDESEEERPIRKRLNRIESEDEEGEEEDEEGVREEEDEEEDEEEEDEEEEEVEEESEVKKTRSVVTNASSLRSPNRHRATAGPKSGGGGRLASKTNGSSRHNGLASRRPSTQDHDDDLYGVTDIVHFVFNSEQAL